ncbi:MAG: hypothetical protein ISQ06_07220 [Planctomycetaceae bacterium]|jgi:uncharacterized membrane protein|nr:hypothetical protein [Planctomycetaceae bacterium]
MRLLLGLNLFSTLAMVGLIWFVQIVHYPMFRHVGEGSFVEYAGIHQRLTTRVVAPFMLVEAFTAVGLLYRSPDAIPPSWLWVGIALVFVVWLSTAILQVPRHGALAEDGFSTSHHSALVTTNWVRTIAWTARGVLMTTIACRLLPS